MDQIPNWERKLDCEDLETDKYLKLFTTTK